MGTFERNLASAKLTFIEKYKWAYEEDIMMLQRALDDTSVEFSPDHKSATFTYPNGSTLMVAIRQPGGARKDGYTPGTIIEC